MITKSVVAVLSLVSFFSSNVFARSYQQVITCNSGAAVVDVDQNDRQHVQLVIRNQGAIKYLYSQGVFNDRSPRECRAIHGRFSCDAPSELIFQGQNRIERGSQHDPGNLPGYPYYLAVSNGEDFKAAEENGHDGLRISFFRDGQGLKVIGYRYIQGYCPGTVSTSTGQCNVASVPGRFEETANWFFDDCV